MPIYERISVAVSLTLIGLALYFVLEFPSQAANAVLFGTPVGVGSPLQWLMAVLLTGLAMSGSDAVILAHPDLPDRRLSYRAHFWAAPGLLVFLATQTLGLASSTLAWAYSLIAVGLLLWITLLAQYRQLSADRPAAGWPFVWHQFISYALALALFTVIYYPRLRSVVSASGVMLTAGLLALALLRSRPDRTPTVWLYSTVIALSLGQMTWALNYWRVGTLQAGLVLFAAFYALTTAARQSLNNRLTRRAVAEIGGVTAVILAASLYLG